MKKTSKQEIRDTFAEYEALQKASREIDHKLANMKMIVTSWLDKDPEILAQDYLAILTEQEQERLPGKDILIDAFGEEEIKPLLKTIKIKKITIKKVS
jgi:hypothetical protein